MTQERRGEEGVYTRESKREGRIKVPIIKGRMIFLGVDVSANSFLNVIPLALFHSGCVTCADMGGGAAENEDIVWWIFSQLIQACRIFGRLITKLWRNMLSGNHLIELLRPSPKSGGMLKAESRINAFFDS